MTKRTLLIVEDDAGLSQTLVQSFARRGYVCQAATSAEMAIQLAKNIAPDFAIVDLKLPGQSGLDCVRDLALLAPEARIVVLTGFASIATAIEAIKLGACHYLAKPATASDIEAAFARTDGDASVPLATRTASLRTSEWELIHETLRESDFCPSSNDLEHPR